MHHRLSPGPRSSHHMALAPTLPSPPPCNLVSKGGGCCTVVLLRKGAGFKFFVRPLEGTEVVTCPWAQGETLSLPGKDKIWLSWWREGFEKSGPCFWKLLGPSRLLPFTRSSGERDEARSILHCCRGQNRESGIPPLLREVWVQEVTSGRA